METEALLTLVNAGLAVAVPLLIGALKKALPRVPKLLLPAIAPLLGVVLAVVTTMATSADVSPLTGAILGTVGVWLREIQDQTFKAVGPKR